MFPAARVRGISIYAWFCNRGAGGRMVEVVRQVVVRAPRDAVYSFLKAEGTDHRFAELSSAARSVGRAPGAENVRGQENEQLAAELQAISGKIAAMVRPNPWLGKECAKLVGGIDSIVGRLKAPPAAGPAPRGILSRERLMDELPSSRVAFLADVDGRGLGLEFDLDERGDSTAVTVRARFADASWSHDAEMIVIGSVKDMLAFEHGFAAGSGTK